jgi:hypothetical protein
VRKGVNSDAFVGSSMNIKTKMFGPVTKISSRFSSTVQKATDMQKGKKVKVTL